MTEQNQNYTPDLTFENLSTRQRLFTERFVFNALASELEITPGHKAAGIKGYFDMVPADESDGRFFSSAENVANYHDEASDFVASHLKLYIPVNIEPDSRREIIRKKADFVTDKLSSGKQEIRSYLHALESGQKPRLPRGAYGYQGLTVTTQNGKTVDLLHTSLPSMRANIWVQDQVFSQFVQWRSDSYLRAKLHGQDTGITRRLYLNPEISHSIGIFTQIVDRAASEGLHVAGKFLDRFGDGATAVLAAASGRPPYNAFRGDGLVFYSNEASANRMLSIAKDVYLNNQSAFAGRRPPKAPMRIADGFAIGDEVPGSSLTSNRAAVLEEVIRTLRTDFNLGYEQIAAGDPRRAKIIQGFNTIWQKIATENGIDPHNLSFNKK